jgi:hypothetical protein
LYIDDKVAFSRRIYDIKEGKWGGVVSEGEAAFKELFLKVM